MSSLWTPDGERPVGRPSPPSAGPPPDTFDGADDGMDEEALAAQVEAMRAELANAPVEVVVANHCYGLFELAAVYLSQQPALLPQARLAIDALRPRLRFRGRTVPKRDNPANPLPPKRGIPRSLAAF